MPYRNYFINKLFLGEMDSQSNLVSISILAKDVGHFKECLAAVLTSSVENTLFNTIDYLFIEVFVFMIFGFWLLCIFYISILCQTYS